MARPKTDDPEARAKILAAAEELFAARGFAGASVRDLARSAGVNGAMIHYYFGNKEGLYRAIIESAASTVRALLLNATSSAQTLEETLRRFVTEYAKYIFSHPNLARVLHRELLAGGVHLKQMMQPATNYKILREALADALKQGEMRKIDIDLAPISLMGMIIVFQLIQPVIPVAVGDGGYDEGFIKRLSDHTVDLFLHGAIGTDQKPAKKAGGDSTRKRRAAGRRA
ncbi:MAG TPA: TetR family transcriptional regulator [Blastocatellia bacterium]|nr:TetR family transcriptional regulator [Blastocatellia bacterium]